MAPSEKQKPDVALVASAEAHGYPTSPDSSRVVESKVESDQSNPFFKSAHWSADGTTVITSLSPKTIRSFVLPEDLLATRSSPLLLRDEGTITLPERTHVLASAPYFSLAVPSTQTALVGCHDHPIQLLSLALTPSPSSPSPEPPSSPSLLATYRLIKPQTDEFLTPSALLWPAPGTHFLTGTTNLLAHFDASRPGSGPIARIPTIPSARHLSKGGGVGMRGAVSALSLQPSSPSTTDPAALVAAGTRTRWVGLYDVARAATPCVATWGVAEAAEGGEAGGVGGRGIMQTLWSPCGRYLVLNERAARGLLVYDVRVGGRLLARLTGRGVAGATNQRLAGDVFAGGAEAGGFEVWAGTEGGRAVVWEGVGGGEGDVEPSWSWEAHGAPVGSTAMHPSGSVVATCSGAWVFEEDGEGSGVTRTVENGGLGIWSVGGVGSDGEPPDLGDEPPQD